MNVLEELLRLANERYHDEHKPKAQPKPAIKRLVPDLKDNDFWDKGEITE